MYKPAAAPQVSEDIKCFFLHLDVVCFYAANLDASDGADSTDCFRITNSSYEYVKWLNRENEVQIQREGETEMKTCIGLQLHEFTAILQQILAKKCCALVKF